MNLNELLNVPNQISDLEKKLEVVLSQIEQLRNPPPPDANELLTREQTAQLLGVSKVTLDQWKKEGLIPFQRFGTRIRFIKGEVLKSGDIIKYKKGRV